MSSWARGTVVPLVVLMAKRPTCRSPPSFTASRALGRAAGARRLRSSSADRTRRSRWRQLLPRSLDRVLKLLGRSPVKPLRERALRKPRATGSSRTRTCNGGWGGIQPAMVNSVDGAPGRSATPTIIPAVAKGIQAIEDFVIEDGDRPSSSNPASRRPGTPRSPPRRCSTPGWRQTHRCSQKASELADRQPDLQSPATGRSRIPTSSPAAGRSSSPTTGIRTPTTRPSS